MKEVRMVPLIVVSLFISFQLLVVAVGGQPSIFKHKGSDYRALCRGKDIDLTTWFELETLVINAQDPNAPDCDEGIRVALIELFRIYHTDNEHICTTQKAYALEQYYREHLQREGAPLALKRFLIMYGLQVSGHCKVSMLNTFLVDARYLLTRNDFEEIKEWTSKSGPVGNLLGAVTEPGGLLLPLDLFAVLPDGLVMEKLAISTLKGNRVKRAKKLCVRRFMPIYRPVAGPVVALMNAGFDNTRFLSRLDEKTRAFMEKTLSQWARIIFLCEAVSSVEVTQDGSGEDFIRVLSDEEASAMEQEINQDEDEQDSGADETPVVRIEYESNRQVSIDNVLFPPDPTNFDIKSAIEAVESGAVADKLKQRLLKRSWRLMKERFKHGEYTRLFKLAIKQISQKWRARNSDVSEERIETVNSELVDALEMKDETLIYKITKPVAKFIRKHYQIIIAFTVIMTLVFV